MASAHCRAVTATPSTCGRIIRTGCMPVQHADQITLVLERRAAAYRLQATGEESSPVTCAEPKAEPQARL
jgi:hypothetical protein